MKRRRLHDHRQRGAIYILVLGCAALVTLIGLTGVTAARLQHRLGNGERDAVEARLLATSAVELAMQRMMVDGDWRRDHTHNTWTADIAFGRGVIAFKFIDDDGDLDDDMSDAVTLYGRGRVGAAVRCYAVTLESDGPAAQTNLLTNPDAEAGVAGWFAHPDATWAELLLKTDSPQAGSNSLWARNRQGAWAGPAQDVAAVIENGQAYRLGGWFWLKDSSEAVRLTLWVRSTGSGTAAFPVTSPVTPNLVWTRLEGSVTPTWSGDLLEARFYAETVSGKQDLAVDSLSMSPRHSAAMRIVPGSWRQIVE